jgi:hypothetical protein
MFRLFWRVDRLRARRRISNIRLGGSASRCHELEMVPFLVGRSKIETTDRPDLRPGDVRQARQLRAVALAAARSVSFDERRAIQPWSTNKKEL